METLADAIIAEKIRLAAEHGIQAKGEIESIEVLAMINVIAPVLQALLEKPPAAPEQQ